MTPDARAILANMTPSERAEAVRYLRLARAARSVTGAVTWRNPRLRPLPWQLDLGRVCDRIVDSTLTGTGARVTLAAPPRHGKTEWTGRGMPLRAMFASKDRPMPVLYATSAKDRAEEVSSRVRAGVARYFEETGDQRYAPGRKWGTLEWETEAGHAWVALGWSGTTGGIGARLLIMDDVIGSSEVYRSKTTRMRIRRVVQEDLLSRLMDGGAALQMETRRGLEDTTGWLLSEYPDTWESHVWPMWTPDRGYLWPEQYGEAWRARNPHLTDNAPVWRSLYQQEPVPEGGAMIPPEHLRRTYPEDPRIAARLADHIVIGADLAFTGKTTSDHTAAVVLGVRGANRDVLDVVRRQMPWLDQKRALRDLCQKWKPSAVVVEEAANGYAIIDELRAYGIPGVRGEKTGGKDKVARLTPWLGTIAADLRLPESAPWRSDLIGELSAFTGVADAHDDQVDALVWAMVAARGGTWTVDDMDAAIAML